ncbi:GNAT family N-acetyltransferase [Rhodobacterales bacterium 52_120_T64]|nr:GNAT family N-acetyltransferase [Rhodobacterales bacterium 52_120_T64]
MKILPAGADDADAIIATWNPIIRDTTVTFNSIEKSARDVAALITDRHAAGQAFLVARQGNNFLGFATYGNFRAGIGYAQTVEHTVMLADHAKGQGVGRALLSALESHARTNDIHSMIASVAQENTAAIAFHKALGFTQVAHIPEAAHKFGRWLDVVFLQKIL